MLEKRLHFESFDMRRFKILSLINHQMTLKDSDDIETKKMWNLKRTDKMVAEQLLRYLDGFRDLEPSIFPKIIFHKYPCIRRDAEVAG